VLIVRFLEFNIISASSSHWEKTIFFQIINLKKINDKVFIFYFS